MKEYTEGLIKDFVKSRDIKAIPAIIVGMQEEDNVSEVISFKNCFRQLRNFAAHEPATIISQLLTADNEMNTRLVLIGEESTEEEPKKVVLDVTQLTAWLFEMYIRTKNMCYLGFWKTLMLILYPHLGELKSMASFEFDVNRDGVLRAYNNWRTHRAVDFKEIKSINLQDPYTIKNYKENPKLFWRLALPSMFVFVEAFLTGELSLRSENNINAYLTFFKIRE